MSERTSALNGVAEGTESREWGHNGPVTRTIRQRAIVHGQVQGVGFRYFAHREAGRRGLAGFVRNRPEGTVEIEIEGSTASVAKMLTWLASGPPSARVESLQVTEIDPLGESGFRVTR